MCGEVPGWIKKGRTVLYKKQRVIVTDYYFTCPCAIGHKDHHESDDLLMLKLKGVGEVPAFKVERDPKNKPPHKVRKQKDPHPSFKKGEVVFHRDNTNLNIWKERGTRAVVKNCYITCPCVEGDIFHSPGLQTRIVELEGVGEVPYENVISYKEYLEKKRSERRMSAIFGEAARRVADDFYIPTGRLHLTPRRKRSKKKGEKMSHKGLICRKMTKKEIRRLSNAVSNAIKLALAAIKIRETREASERHRKRKNKRENKR
ncbi:MAG: hypothetical protein AAB568_01065 [Patescibacteria group bacterium]